MAEWVVEVSAELEPVRAGDESDLWESRYKVSQERFPTWQKALDEGAHRAETEIGDREIIRLRATIFDGLQEHRLDAT